MERVTSTLHAVSVKFMQMLVQIYLSQAAGMQKYNVKIIKKAINLNRYLYNENAILPLKDPTMSNHPLKLWTKGFPNVALYNHLFKSCSYFILHIVFELFANVRKNQPL